MSHKSGSKKKKKRIEETPTATGGIRRKRIRDTTGGIKKQGDPDFGKRSVNPEFESQRDVGAELRAKNKEGIESTELRVVGRKEAFKTAKEAGGVSPAAERRKQAGGFQNVIDVFGIALNPFSEDKIVANTDNRVFNTAAEYVANNPFTTALMLQGLQGIGRFAVGRIAARKAAAKGVAKAEIDRLIGTVGDATIRYRINTKTAKLSAGILGKVMAATKSPVFILSAIGGIIGTYPWAEWAAGEAAEIMGFTTKKAIDTGDPELIKETQRIQNEIFNPSVWEQIGRNIPLANIAVGFNKKFKALLVQREVNDKLTEKALAKLQGAAPNV